MDTPQPSPIEALRDGLTRMLAELDKAHPPGVGVDKFNAQAAERTRRMRMPLRKIMLEYMRHTVQMTKARRQANRANA